MMYNVRGVSRSASEWADTLGITNEAMGRELYRGRSMDDIVASFQTDTFSAFARPAPLNRTSSTFTSGIPGPNGSSIVTLAGTCKVCMARARDMYDGLHARHLAEATPSRTPLLPVPERPKD